MEPRLLYRPRQIPFTTRITKASCRNRSAFPQRSPTATFQSASRLTKTERAEQFAAFLRARAAENSAAPDRAGERSHALPPPVRFEWSPRDGASSPPPWARAHEVARGRPFVGDAPGGEVPNPVPQEGDGGETAPTSPALQTGGVEPDGETPLPSHDRRGDRRGNIRRLNRFVRRSLQRDGANFSAEHATLPGRSRRLEMAHRPLPAGSRGVRRRVVEGQPLYRFRALEAGSRVGAHPAHGGVLGGLRT